MLLIQQAVCNCTLITWDEPAQMNMVTYLETSPPDTITFTMAEPNEASKTASPAIRACTRNGGACDTTSSISIADDSTLLLDTAFMSVVGTTLTV